MARNFWGPGGRERARAPEAGARFAAPDVRGGVSAGGPYEGESCNAQSAGFLGAVFDGQ